MKSTSAPRAARKTARLVLGALALMFGARLAAQDATWTDIDIGTATAGSTSPSAGQLTIQGSGADIYGATDAFHYYYRPWSGDGMFIVRVTSVQYTFNWAKAGLMVRGDLTSNAQHALAFISPEKNTALVYRPTTGGNTTGAVSVPDAQKVLPMWIKLIREGDAIAMDYSFDGIVWARRGTTSIAMPANVYVGLAVCSHVEGTLCTSMFDQLSVGPVTPTQLGGIAHAPTRVDLKWVDNNLDETGFEIERAAGNPSGFALVGTAAANSTTFSDATASAGTTFYYRVRATSSHGPSAYSNVIAVSTPPPSPAGWSSADVGDTAASGSSTLSGGVFTISGAGAGVGGVRYDQPPAYRGDYGAFVTGFADEFQNCWQTWNGDGEIVMRVASLSGASTGQAGAMVRVAASDESSFNVFVAAKPGGSVTVTARPGTTTTSMGYLYYYQRETNGYYSSSGNALPLWLKLVRQGDGVMSYSSVDGTSWTELAWVTTPLASTVQFGMGVSSENDGAPPELPAVLTATFDNVRIGAITTPIPPPVAPTNVHATAVAQSNVALAWTNPTSPNDGIEVQSSGDGVNFSSAATRLASNSYTFYGLTGDADYYYRLRTWRGSAASNWTDVLRVHTLAYPAAPSNLTATVMSSTRVDLTWQDNSTTESGFDLWYSTNGGPTNWAASLAANTTTYSMTALNPGTTYTFHLTVSPAPPGQSLPQSNAVTVTTPSGSTAPPVAPSNLTATATGPTQVSLTWTDNSSNETGFRLERSTDGANFTLLQTFTFNTTSYTDVAASAATTFYYRVRASNGDATPSTWSNTAQATTPAGSAWTSRDIGAVAATGSSTQSGSTFTLVGSGFDIWNQADEFRYTYEPWTGDGTITASVTRLDDTYGWAKAGLMFRANLADTSPHAMMCVSAEHGTDFQYRASQSDFSNSAPASEVGGVPRWIRLVRSGSTFSGYESTDGISWTPRGSITIADLPATIYVGMAVTSHNDGVLCTATFESVTLAGASAPAPTAPAAPTVLSASAQSSTEIKLTWADNATNETDYEVQRSTDGVNFGAAMSAGGANKTTFTDSGLSASTTYSYRVRAVNGAGASAYSNIASATTLAPTGSTTWTARDVGTVAIAGSSGESGGPVTLRGSGADTWNDADAFQYRYQLWNGDGEIIAHVASLTDTNGWTKAGIMFRESNEAGSRHAMMIVSAEHGIALQWRATTGGLSDSTAGSGSAAPRWLRLVRSGSTFLGYESPDGTTWSPVGSITINVAAVLEVGLVVTSHQDGTLATAVFDNVTVRASTSSGLAAPTGLAATAVASNQVNLTWTDNSSGETGFEVQMASSASGAFSAVGNVGANVTSASVGNLYPEIAYYFRVRAFDANGTSSFSNVATATTPAAPAPASLGAPSNLTATAMSSSTIRLTWTDNASSELGFEVGLSTDGVNFQWGTATTANVTTVNVAGLSSSTVYWFQVRAYQSNSAGTGYVHSGASNTVSASTLAPPQPATAPAAPTNLVATAAAYNQVNLSWTDNSNNEDGFEIDVSMDQRTFSRIGTAAANATTFSHTGLAGGTTYFYRVAALNSAGPSAYTSVASVTTPPAPASPWTSQDIGAVGVAGSTSETSGGVNLTASGSDIWNTADAFRYYYQAMTGDGQLTVWVSSLAQIDGWTKAGVMFRETLAPGSRHATMLVSAAHGSMLQYRTATGGDSGTSPNSELTGAPRWIRIVRSGDTFTGYDSPDNVTWTQRGSITLTGTPATIYVGLAVTSHNNATLAEADFGQLTLTGGSGSPPPPPPPSPTATWFHADIGSVGVAGSDDADTANASITVRGSGSDFWDVADAGRFVYQQRSGDCVVEAQIKSMDNTNSWAKAGVMIRESTAAGARNVFAFLTPSLGMFAQARSTTNATTAQDAGPWWAQAGYWVRLARTGNTFVASASPDGVTWTTVATYTTSMNADVLVGFAVTSHDNSVVNAATFGEPSIH